jgi:hypothetical protein
VSLSCKSITVNGGVVPAITVCNQSLSTPTANTSSDAVSTSCNCKRTLGYLTRAEYANQTLPAVEANYFVDVQSGYSYAVTLPNVEVMAGKSITFVSTNTFYEAWFSIYGPIYVNDTYFTLNAYASVTFLSDGTRWWITSYYQD